VTAPTAGLQLALRRLRHDRARLALAVLALALAAGTLSARAHVERAWIEPVERALERQGPNLQVVAPARPWLERAAAERAVRAACVDGGARISPELLAPASLLDRTVAVRGVEAARLAACEPYLAAGNEPLGRRALVGARLAERLGLRPGRPLALEFEDGARLELRVARVLRTGGPEEDQVLADLAGVQRALGAPGRVSRLLVVSPAGGAELVRQAAALRAALPGSAVRAGRDGEVAAGALLGRWRVLLDWAAGLVVLAAAAAVLASGLALRDRDRAEAALMKTLGASDRQVLGAGAVEALLLGLVAGPPGGALGYLLALGMARALGAEALPWRPAGLAAACAAALALSLLAALVPLAEALRARPARWLRT